MSFDIGDKVPLSISITDESEQLANAGSVSLTITLPDGSLVTQGPITPTSTGIYDYDYLTVQAGRHHVYWQATGVNAAAFDDAFDVVPADDGDFISLADAKSHLNKTSTEDDEELRGFVGAACQMITDRTGQISPTTVVADRPVRCGVVVLPTRPVLSITSVVQLPGGAAVAAANPLTGTDGWTLKNSEGVLTVTGWDGDVRVTYRAGRTPIPANVRLAALELVAHLWRGSQHNQAGGRPALGAADALAASVRPYAMPYRVMELLGLKKDQERDEIFVG